MSWARARTHVGKAAFRKFVFGFDTLVRDDSIADDFVLYNTPHFDVTTNDFKDGSLRLKYVANDRAVVDDREREREQGINSRLGSLATSGAQTLSKMCIYLYP